MCIGLFCRSLFIFEASFVSIRVDGVAGRRHCRQAHKQQPHKHASVGQTMIHSSGTQDAQWLHRDYDYESVIVNTSTKNL